MYVHSLHTYPVKSCSGITHSSLLLNELGPENDRIFMLVDDAGAFVTQRKHPVMSQIYVDIEGGSILCQFNGKKIRGDIPCDDSVSREISVKVWKDSVRALVFDSEINQWFSSVLGMSVRLVNKSPASKRRIDPEYDSLNRSVSFADGFPILLTSKASLDFINKHLPNAIDMQRFRPNIVVEGVADAFAEDQWQTVEINGVQFDVVKPCTRCVIPSIHLHSLEKERDVIQVLKRYRKTDEGLVFGQNLIHRSQGVINVGDELTILK